MSKYFNNSFKYSNSANSELTALSIYDNNNVIFVPKITV